MIRHIPNKYDMASILEDFNKGFKDKFDVLYLPLDKTNNCNLGFAFINFIDPIHIIHFYDEFRGKRWQKFNSDKICELAFAKFQGKKDLLSHIDKNCVVKTENNVFIQNISVGILELPLVKFFKLEIFRRICEYLSLLKV